jgi:phytoene synthase
VTVAVGRADFDACRSRDALAKSLAWLLPREKAGGVVAIVAGCRMVRETICESTSGSCGSTADVVELVRSQMERVFEGSLELPNVEFRDASQHVLAAFATTVARFEVPRELVMRFVEACREDLGTVRYATWKSLLAHCEGVGGSVARMIACVLGATHSDVGRFAMELGAAWRLVSLCACVRPDLERGRVYLPLEDLIARRVSERELAARYREVVEVEIARARALIDSASGGVAWLAGDGSRLFGGMVVEVLRWRCDRVTELRPSMMALVRMLPGAMRMARGNVAGVNPHPNPLPEYRARGKRG